MVRLATLRGETGWAMLTIAQFRASGSLPFRLATASTESLGGSWRRGGGNLFRPPAGARQEGRKRFLSS